MKTTKQRLFVLISLLILVLAIPVYMVVRNEYHLSGTDADYKFRIRPVDPSDPVRGKYIRLDYEVARSFTSAELFERGERVYVVVEKNENGWAYFKSFHHEIPAVPNYFTTTARFSFGSDVSVEIPFDRYYLNEELAALGESEYWNIVASGDSTFYALVTIRDGDALLKEVYYKDQPYREYLRKLLDSSELSIKQD